MVTKSLSGQMDLSFTLKFGAEIAFRGEFCRRSVKAQYFLVSFGVGDRICMSSVVMEDCKSNR